MRDKRETMRETARREAQIIDDEVGLEFISRDMVISMVCEAIELKHGVSFDECEAVAIDGVRDYLREA